MYYCRSRNFNYSNIQTIPKDISRKGPRSALEMLEDESFESNKYTISNNLTSVHCNLTNEKIKLESTNENSHLKGYGGIPHDILLNQYAIMYIFII